MKGKREVVEGLVARALPWVKYGSPLFATAAKAMPSLTLAAQRRDFCRQNAQAACGIAASVHAAFMSLNGPS